MGWTDKQSEAIYDRGNSLLLSAAAGSGKTAVLVERIISLLTESGASLDRMLIVTFTKAAASEMRERLRKKLGERFKDADEEVKKLIKRQLSLIGRAEICTFDSFAQRLVRNYYQVIGVDPGLKVCDNYKSSILKKEAMDEMFTAFYEKKDEDFLDYLDHYSSARSDMGARDLVLDLYEYTDTLPSPEAFLEDPFFSVEKLMVLAGDFALLALERALAYCERLKELFEKEDMPKCLKTAKDAWSDMDSMISGIKSGHVEETMSHICAYKFPTLAAGKADEKEKKKALDELIKAYWDKGAKEAINDFRDAFKGISKERLEDEKKRLEKAVSQLCFLTKEFSRRYKEKKSKAGFMDFSDGEHFALEILKNDDVRKECREKYRCVFVDEYQDCNPVQESLIEAISSGDNLFTVGDVKQSIYRFRHAEPGLFLSRYDDYARGKENCKNIDLNSNFRSKKTIIDFVNRLFENLMTKESSGMDYDENAALKEGIPYGGPENCLYEPELYLVDTREDEEADEAIADLKSAELEAVNAAEIISKYHDGGFEIFDGDKPRPLMYRDMVILLRSAKTKAEIYYEALTKRGIPVYLDRNEGYFDTPEIQVFINLLRIIDNPRQDVALISVLYFPSFGFSAEELARIRIEGRKSGKRHPSFYDAFRFVSEQGPSDLAQKCREVLKRLDGWKTKASALPLADFLWDLLSESGIFVFAAGLSSGEQRVANLRALVDKAEDFERTNTGGIYSFISYIDVISDENSKVSTGQSSVASEEDDVVRIMTVHKSKGLEFPFVLFASCGGRLSGGKDHPRAVFHKDLGTSMVISNPSNYSYVKPVSFKLIEAKKKKEELAEEIRILYVAATRAKDIFVMSAAVKGAEAEAGKAGIYEIKGAGCSSFAQMTIPAIADGKLIIKQRSSLDSLSEERAAADAKALRKSLEEGFDIDSSKLSIREDEIKRRLSFDYSPSSEESEKKKYSVSELAREEREKEGKASYEFDKEPAKPKFLTGKMKLSSASIGTAYHKVMQHIPFTREAGDVMYVKEFVDSLLTKGVLTEDEAAAVRPDRIAEFFKSGIGKKVCSAKTVKKETPFVIKHVREGRTVLLQGTIDCWFEDEGKIYLVDYKSNYLDLKDKQSELERLKEEYKTQLKLYREALEKILGRKVEASYLYLFSAGEYISIGE